MDPISGYMTAKEAAATARKEEELRLWQQWKSGGKKPEDLSPLLRKYTPVFNQKIRMWKAPNVPEEAFLAELQTHFIKALDTYKPEKAALNTHVEQRLQKAKRYNTQHQNFGYIPEGQTKHIGAINRAIDSLTEENAVAPTPEDIYGHLQDIGYRHVKELTPARIATIQKNRRKDSAVSQLESDPLKQVGSFEQQQIAVAARILPDLFPNKPDMHAVFNHTFGTNGYPQILSTGALAKELGKKAPQVARMRTVIGNTLRKHMGLDEK